MLLKSVNQRKSGGKMSETFEKWWADWSNQVYPGMEPELLNHFKSAAHCGWIAGGSNDEKYTKATEETSKEAI